MNCEGNRDIAKNIAMAANRLTEAKVAPGSDIHVSAMEDLLNSLHEPGALDALIRVVGKNGKSKTATEIPLTIKTESPVQNNTVLEKIC